VPPETFTYRWPRVSALRDLAYTRTLPLRQNLGQFLSRYDPALITAGLQGVTLRHAPGLEAEGHCIVSWIAKGFTRAGLDCSALERRVESLSGPGSFTLEFNYDVPGKSFRWLADLGRNHAEFEGDLGSGRSTLAVGARLLQPEEALAEAMFG